MMSQPRFRNEVLNPCPTCGARFDFNGCMTFVDYLLEKTSGGKCPKCGTQLVYQVLDRFQPEVWDNATTLSEIRNLKIDQLDLSVKTRNLLAKVGVTTVGELLVCTEAQLRSETNVSDRIIAEIEQLLADKGLKLSNS